ncbi:MAG: AraC family transcriptional regulator ligand-binding domain-containing protein [Acidobacteriota bacterium]
MLPVRHRCHLDNTVTRLERLGVEPRPLLTRSGLDGLVDGGSDYLPLEPVLDFQERAAAEVDDPLFGLSFGLDTRPEDIALLGYLAVHSRTVRAAFESLASFFRLHQTQSEVTITDDGASCHLTYELRPRALFDYRQDVDFGLGFGINLIRTLTGSIHHTEVCLPSPRLRGHGDYQDRCRSSVRLGRPSASLVVPREVMDAPLSNDDPALFGILADYARLKVARAEPDPLIASVKRAAGRALADPEADLGLDAVARSLHMGARTLQRKLRERGTSFRTLLDELRHSLALDYLRRPTTAPSDVALALGFSELSAFDRAFRRWTGRSPSDYRNEAPAAALPVM